MTMPGSSGTCASKAATASSALRFGRSSGVGLDPAGTQPVHPRRHRGRGAGRAMPEIDANHETDTTRPGAMLVPPPPRWYPAGHGRADAPCPDCRSMVIARHARPSCRPRDDHARWLAARAVALLVGRVARRAAVRPSTRPDAPRSTPRHRRPPIAPRLDPSPSASPSADPSPSAVAVAHRIARHRAVPDAHALPRRPSPTPTPTPTPRRPRHWLADVRDHARAPRVTFYGRGWGHGVGHEPVRRAGPGARRPDGGADPRRVLQGLEARRP